MNSTYIASCVPCMPCFRLGQSRYYYRRRTGDWARRGLEAVRGRRSQSHCCGFQRKKPEWPKLKKFVKIMVKQHSAK